MKEATRRKAIDLALVRLAERFGSPDGAIPAGSPPLETLLGRGGLRRGRLVEIFGAAGSGKTTLTLHAIAEAQAGGGTAAFLDAEHALDPAYAARLGVDLGRLIVIRPGCGEEALEIAAALALSRTVDLIAIDSVAALVPRAELEGGAASAYPHLHSRLMTQGLRKLVPIAARTGTAFLFVNQLRAAPDGIEETSTGGFSLKLRAAVRIRLGSAAEIRERGTSIGCRIRMRVVKNSLEGSLGDAEQEIFWRPDGAESSGFRDFRGSRSLRPAV